MRSVLISLLGLALLFPGGESARAAIRSLSSSLDYARISTWARTNGLGLRWTAPMRELHLTNSHVSIVLTHDSRRLRVNGIGVWISGPVIMRDQDAFIPTLDLPTTLRPLLTPHRAKQPSLRVICLDPGHGGDDTGKRDGSRNEKQYTLLLARELGRLLTQSGYRVVYTRTTDTKVELPQRPEVARRARADLFISLHFNAADIPSAQGVEVYCLTPLGASSTNAGGEGANSPSCVGNRQDARNLQLAFELQKTLVRRLNREDRGVRRARFAVLRDATMPAVLIEAGFMSNPVDSQWIYSSAERTRLSKAIMEAIQNFRKTSGL